MKKVILKKHIKDVNNIFDGNNRCTTRKCPKSVQNIYTFLKSKSKKIKTSTHKIKNKDKMDILYDKYEKLLNNMKKRKTYKKYVDCTCQICKKSFVDNKSKNEDIFQILDLIPDNENINVKKYIDKSIKVSKKLRNKINQTCI